MEDLILEHVVASYECNADTKLKPESYMHLCQEMAESHASRNNLGYEWGMSHGMCWVETQGDYVFLRRPSWKRPVYLRTNTGKASPLQARRFVEMKDETGEVIARADLMWVLIDLKTRRPIPFRRTDINMPDECPATIEDMEAVDMTGAETATAELTAPRHDTDFNGHINNSAYLTWVLDTLPESMIPSEAPRRFHISFRKECFAGHQISISHARLGNRTEHCIRRGEEVCAEISIDW